MKKLKRGSSQLEWSETAAWNEYNRMHDMILSVASVLFWNSE